MAPPAWYKNDHLSLRAGPAIHDGSDDYLVIRECHHVPEQDLGFMNQQEESLKLVRKKSGCHRSSAQHDVSAPSSTPAAPPLRYSSPSGAAAVSVGRARRTHTDVEEAFGADRGERVSDQVKVGLPSERCLVFCGIGFPSERGTCPFFAKETKQRKFL